MRRKRTSKGLKRSSSRNSFPPPPRLLKRKDVEQVATISSKTLDIEEFKKFIKYEEEREQRLEELYASELFRTLRWHAYIGRARSFTNLVSAIKEKFGKPEDIVLAYGHWRGANLQNSKPSIGVGL